MLFNIIKPEDGQEDLDDDEETIKQVDKQLKTTTENSKDDKPSKLSESI